MYTGAQTAYMCFPEFMYSASTGSFRVLDRITANTFSLPANPAAEGNARLHFVPLWFPNTSYIAQGYVADIWTPAGMMSAYRNTAAVKISQSAYDDWYIGR
jgi:hypothetical protein